MAKLTIKNQDQLNEVLAEECGVDYDEYDIWFHENESAILIELAESGADRELCFNLETEFNKRFQLWLDGQS